MISPFKIKPFEIKPLNLIDTSTSKPLMGNFTLNQSQEPPPSERGGMLPDTGKQPPATPAHIQKYREEYDTIVPPTILSSLKRHKSDVLHGGRSLNALVETKRESKDFDVYSSQPKRRAQEIEASIDRKVGADIAAVKKVYIPKGAGPPHPTPSSEPWLYQVVTPLVHGDHEADYMKTPHKLKTVRKEGITHEALPIAYKKAEWRKQAQPLFAGKASQDMRRIEEHWMNHNNIPSEFKDRIGKVQQFGFGYTSPLFKSSQLVNVV